MKISKKYCLNKFLIVALMVFILVIGLPFAYSQDKAPPTDKVPAITKPAVTKIDGAPVVLGDQTLFVIKVGVGSFSAEERSQAVTNRIETIAKDPTVPVSSLTVSQQLNTTNILSGDKVIFTVTNGDGKAAGKTTQELGDEYVKTISSNIINYRKDRSLKNILFGVIYTFIATIVLWIVFKILNQIFNRIFNWITNWHGHHIPAVSIQNFEILPASRITHILSSLVKAIRFVIVLGILYIYTPLVLSFFPWTRKISTNLLNYFFLALEGGVQGLIAYLPKLIALAIIIVCAYYLIKFIRPIFRELGNGSLSLPGFYPEWAEPTFKLALFLIVALALVVALPFLPGFGSPAFQGISVFLGILLSLGSSAAVANIVAGVILIYTRAFRIGDRIKINDAMGDIVEKTLFVTRIRTIKNVVITIPNGTVLTSQITNYSALAQDADYYLVLHSTVTLGYDVPWRKVHHVLTDAALATSHILKEPAPFILQTSLDDFYVSYEINAYTNQPAIMARIYSELHQNIQDKCNEADIEILSPHYSAIRDGNQITIPENYLPKDYQTPGFRFSPLKNLSNSTNGKDAETQPEPEIV
ncbi:mechanosensitive ion channel family protein [Brunnivagina elsteri]|uniref:Mechanosensitive ion channel protein n=1 Tax=Brunnivagina elsteri CCALA 953 TaxID=987040 RepID=A0A2A2TAX6_9CYAN|nr:mechanosensitive ion channel family protein [Calothrix elsteri]PAX49099.1 mechanosensitive ion channel protein [Calothrix elsteri CCALA 953]